MSDGRDAKAGRGTDAARACGVSTSRRILVVDDDLDCAELIGELLRRGGHDVALAHDGPNALALAETFQPEIALLDLGLPLLDGLEVARRLRARGSRARLIAVTGYGQPDDRERTRDAGFDLHLTKPIDIASLRAAIA